MKPLVVVLLVASLVANAVLLFLINIPRGPADTTALRMARTMTEQYEKDQSLRTALASGDAAALAAAGCPPEVTRALILGRAYHRQQERLRAVIMPKNFTYWRRDLGLDPYSGMAREQRAEYMKAQREFQDELTLAGEEPAWGANTVLTSFLPADLRQKLRRIDQDYAEMNMDARAEAGNLQLPSDKDKLKLLQTEKERDIAAALGPELYAQYQLHVSATAYTVRNRYGSVINSEQEYATLYAVQKSFDDQYGGPDPAAGNDPAARREAEQKLQENVSTLLGPERVQSLLHSSDAEYKTLTNLTKRFDLPASTPDAIYATRDAYAAESAQIIATPGLSAADQSTQLKALAARAQADMEKTLGTAAGQAFAGRALWITTLKNGSAFTTAPASATPLNPAITVIPPHK